MSIQGSTIRMIYIYSACPVRPIFDIFTESKAKNGK